MVFRIADNRHAAAACNHHVALRHALRGVVSPFGMNVRTQQTDKTGDIGRIEDRHRVNICHGRKDLRALAFRHTRAAFALECARAGIRVNGHNQLAAKLLGCPQIADVAYVKKVETSIGQDDLLACGAPLADQLRQIGCGKNFLASRRQSALHDGAQQFSAGYRGRAALHHHNASGVIGQARGRFRIGPGGQGSGIGCDHGVAGPSHVRNFV